MPPTDSELRLRAVFDVGPVEAGMQKMSAAVQTATEKTSQNFTQAGKSVATAEATMADSFSHLPVVASKAGAAGVLAFEEVKRRVIESTKEVAALREEILHTNDSAHLEQLQAQLSKARQEMTIARGELRGMRMEMSETREKADLLGESLGVRIPSSLGRLLGQIPFLQTAMEAAFAPILVLFFADAILKVVEGINKATESLAGYTEEVKKSLEEAKKANEEQLRHAGSIVEAHQKIAESNRRLGEIGKSSFSDFTESAKKAKEETSTLLDTLTLGAVSSYRTMQHVTTDAANETVVLNERLREQERALIEVGAAEDRAALKSKERLEAAARIGKSRVEQLREEIAGLDDLKTHEIQIAVKEVGGKKGADGADRARAVAEVEAEFAAKRLELQRQLSEQAATISIAATKSAVAARQAIETAYINFYESGLRQMLAAGQITLAQEIEGEKAAAQQRLAIKLAEIEQQKALALREQSATGKDATPELIALNEKRESAEIQTQQKLNEIEQRGAQEALRNENEIALARIQAKKTVGDAELNEVEQRAKLEFDAQKISLEEYIAVLKSTGAQRIDLQRAVDAEQLRQAQEFPEKNKKQIIALNADLESFEKEKVAKLEALDAEYTSKHLAEQRREMEETLRFVEETSARQLSAALSTDDRRLRSHQITLAQWGALEKAAVEKWAAEDSAALNAELAKAKAIYGQDALEYKKLQDKKALLDQQRLAKLNQIDEQIVAKETQAFNKITDQMNRAVLSWIDGQQSFGVAMSHVWETIANTVIENILKMMEQMILAEIEHKALAQSGIFVDAKAAAAHAFKWVMEDVPFPANVALAPAAAAAAFAGVMAFGAFEKGGIVPETGMNLLHKNEMVLDPGLSNFVRNAAASRANSNETTSRAMAAAVGAIRDVPVRGVSLRPEDRAALAAAPGGITSGGHSSDPFPGKSAAPGATTHKTMNNRMHIEVHNHKTATMSQEEIVKAVKTGMRRGSLKLEEF
jgi:hypothetical protein